MHHSNNTPPNTDTLLNNCHHTFICNPLVVCRINVRTPTKINTHLFTEHCCAVQKKAWSIQDNRTHSNDVPRRVHLGQWLHVYSVRNSSSWAAEILTPLNFEHCAKCQFWSTVACDLHQTFLRCILAHLIDLKCCVRRIKMWIIQCWVAVSVHVFIVQHR